MAAASDEQKPRRAFVAQRLFFDAAGFLFGAKLPQGYKATALQDLRGPATATTSVDGLAECS
ncbi:MAG TPA: hypothetical protein VGY31_06105 [Terriglobia bacterium]|nr:hypothetical protein [Terriglobia bacterium]